MIFFPGPKATQFPFQNCVDLYSDSINCNIILKKNWKKREKAKSLQTSNVGTGYRKIKLQIEEKQFWISRKKISFKSKFCNTIWVLQENEISNTIWVFQDYGL